MEEDLYSIGIRPKNIDHYVTAFRHKSTGHTLSNERLEFLGDTVLATAVSSYLVDRYPACNEGFLTKMRTKLVRGTTLTALAGKIRLDKMLVLSARAENSDAAMEDALEALIGAIFVDKGFEAAEAWVRSLYEKYFDFSEAVQQEVTDKERLLRCARSAGDELTFDTCKVIQGYKVIIKKLLPSSQNGVVIGVGDGASKKDASDRACAKALNTYTSSC